MGFKVRNNTDKIKPYDKATPSQDKASTPHNKDFEESALTHFAHSLLEKISRKGDGTSTKSNDNYISNKTGENKKSESQKKSCKRKHKLKKCHRRKTMRKELLKEENQAEDISLKKSKQPKDGSIEISEAMNTCKSIKSTMKRRRSKTGVEIKGLALTSKQFDNFVVEEESV